MRTPRRHDGCTVFPRPGPPPPGAMRRGFTLLELLIVILIIGVIATFAVISVGGRALDDRMETEARRLQQLLALAADEAVLQGVELGFRYTADGYSFLYVEPGSTAYPMVWSAMPDDLALRARQLEEPFFLELRVEDRLVPPADAKDADEPVTPQVVLFSSGETTAFKLRIGARDHPSYFELESDVVGRMALTRKDAS